MRIFILILLLLVCYLALCQRVNIQGSVEKYEDVFENSYYPIWTGSFTYYCNIENTKYVEFSSWGDAEEKSFIYINITFNLKALWISINPLRADIYNPSIQLGYNFQIFHPPRSSVIYYK